MKEKESMFIHPKTPKHVKADEVKPEKAAMKEKESLFMSSENQKISNIGC